MNMQSPFGHKRITATEANRNFSRVLREVAGGTTYIVTSHGRDIARIEPFSDPVGGHDTESLMAFVDTLPRRHAGDWSRADLYE